MVVGWQSRSGFICLVTWLETSGAQCASTRWRSGAYVGLAAGANAARGRG